MEQRIEIREGVFVVRPYDDGDEAGVLSLWQAAFGKEISSSLWRWKYLENPYPVQIALAVGEDGRTLVMYGGIPYRANWEGKTVTITHLMDIMSHPDCRGSGLFVKTGMAFFDLFAGPGRTLFYYGFPGKYHFDIGKKYLAYSGFQGGVAFLMARAGALARKSRWPLGRIERITEVDDAFDGLWKRSVGDYPLAVIRDAAFLQWRFFEHPLRRYEMWGYRPYLHRELRAYAVFSVEGETARMVDILCPPSKKAAGDFLARLGRQFDERGIREIQTWLPKDHFLGRLAVSAGFNPFQEPLGFIPTGRSFHPGLSMDWASQHLYYTMADGDLL
jgi:hypothetical protein